MTDFAATKALFHLPEGMIYLDGNSLGPLPRAAPARMAAVMADEWGQMLIGGWNTGGTDRSGWVAQPTRMGAGAVGAAVGWAIRPSSAAIIRAMPTAPGPCFSVLSASVLRGITPNRN